MKTAAAIFQLLLNLYTSKIIQKTTAYASPSESQGIPKCLEDPDQKPLDQEQAYQTTTNASLHQSTTQK